MNNNNKNQLNQKSRYFLLTLSFLSILNNKKIVDNSITIVQSIEGMSNGNMITMDIMNKRIDLECKKAHKERISDKFIINFMMELSKEDYLGILSKETVKFDNKG